MNCEICAASTHFSVSDWTRVCCDCGLWQSSLQPEIDSLTLSEQTRAKGVAHVRLTNFETVLERMALFIELKGSHLLDVGCAYGWFIEAAQRRGIVGLGIEPDKRTAAIARFRGLSVIEGYFPQCLNGNQSFDIIVFNDTFEHIPNVHSVFSACNGRLRGNGLLVLNIPTSAGTLFWIAKSLAKLGWSLPWNRLWQSGLPSPHLYYFNADNIDRGLKMHGFHRVLVQETDAFHPKGLWSRLLFYRRSNILVNILLYIVLVLIHPLYKLMGRSDTILLIYRRGLATER